MLITFHPRCNFVTRVKILLRAKADISIANHKKELPLHRACSSDKNIEVTEEWLSEVAGLNLALPRSLPPSLFFSLLPSPPSLPSLPSSLISPSLPPPLPPSLPPPFLKALLYFTEMSDVNIQDADGWTPLMYAAKSQSPVTSKYLLQHGADPNITQVGVAGWVWSVSHL